MKKMKKIFALLIAMIMVLGMSTSVFAAQDDGKTASITINTDSSYEGTDQQYKYKAYKIFDASYDSLTGTWTQANKDADPQVDITYAPNDAKVAYFMKTGNPWISTVQGLTDYFTVTAAADSSGFVVVAKEGFDSTAEAKELANALKNAIPSNLSGDYEGIEITANGTAVNVQPGYYLIVGDTASNLALVTTDVTIVEKNEYPDVIKEFTDETHIGINPSTGEAYTADQDTSANDTVQIGDTVSYTLTVIVPSGANQELVITDTFTSGLEPVLDNGKVAITASGLAENTSLTSSAPANSKFTITMSDEDVAKNAGKTLTIVYQAVVTADAWYQTEVNTGQLKYGNDYTSNTDSVDSVTYHVELDKKANSETGDDLGGAKFQILVGDEKTVVNLVELSDTDLTKLGTDDAPFVKAAKTIYYRVADKNDASSVIKTEIDMTAKEGNDYKYAKAVVYGLDGDLTYYARETQAPIGFNAITDDYKMEMNDQNHTYPIVNKQGSVLPSTGGIGTTIFYAIGAVLVIGAGIVLVTRRRMNAQ